MPASAVARHRDAVVEAAEAADDSTDLLAVLAERIGRLVPYDGACWFGTDPTTLFASLPVRIENITSGHCQTYWQREFLVEDLLLFRDLAAQERPAGTLLGASDGLPARSARYRGFLAPQGYEDELRFVFREADSTWGLVALMRHPDQPAFTPQETAFVASLSQPLAGVLRRRTLLEQSQTATGLDGPGVVTFDDQMQLTSLNDNADAWFDDLGAGETFPGEMPVAVQTVMAHARAVAQGRQRGSAMLRVRCRSGRWATLHASCTRNVDGSAGPTVVIIERSVPSHLRPIFEQAYGLSPREQQVTAHLARGASTAAIAAQLYLSEHTVRDHVKSILAKVGVGSRGELVAKLFAEHVEPGIHETPVHF